jgi:hypothetical protein
VQFSGEEMFGKYLDLHQFYEKFCNMPQFERCVSVLCAMPALRALRALCVLCVFCCVGVWVCVCVCGWQY